MARKSNSSPSTTGVRPRMAKMYDGRNVATRPIPIITDTSEQRAIAAAAADQKPKASVVNMPSKPRPAGADTILGTKTGSYDTTSKGVYNPSAGIEKTL
jgi:hypothetical protein